jgi:hypothetical protein
MSSFILDGYSRKCTPGQSLGTGSLGLRTASRTLCISLASRLKPGKPALRSTAFDRATLGGSGSPHAVIGCNSIRNKTNVSFLKTLFE